MVTIDYKSAFFKDGKFVKQSVRAKKYDDFFTALSAIHGTDNRSELLWLLDNERPVCRECGSFTKYKNYECGYAELCSLECLRKNDLTNQRRINSIKGFFQMHHKVENPMQLESTKAAVSSTVANRYGVNWYTQTATFKEESEKSSLQTWGTKIPSQAAELKDRIKQNVISKYGRECARDFSEQRKIRIERVIDWCLELGIGHQEFDADKNLRDEIYSFTHECGHTWCQTIDTLPACSVCHRGSKVEQSVKEWIKSLDIDYKFNDRTQIKPLELDVFIPSRSLAVEVNGLYWHHDDSGRTSVKDKTDICQKAGIHLVSIWEHEWADDLKRKKIQSMIKVKLGLADRKVYARQTEVVDVGLDEARDFLNANHIQGWASASKTVGLKLGDELVMVMSTGVRRWCTGSDVEIIRLCTKNDVIVIGGFSKLLKQFAGVRLLSYCDRRFGSGAGYEAAGFTLDGISKPNYVWWKHKYFLPRGSTTKKRLPKLLGDAFNPNLSEDVNMRAAGWKKLSDAGNLRYVYISRSATPS